MAHRDGDVVGRTIDGRYTVVRHIADGGMASVYLALDTRLDRNVALKILQPTLADRPGFAERFEREARSAARLSHPNVVAVQDQGQDGDVVFIVMELVRGTTLRGVIDAGGLTVGRALSLQEQLLAGLAAAHRRGLIHGDVKPENALVDDDGVVKLSDFGLVRAASATERHDGLILGTEAYAAPEITGAANPSIRADVYSAGLVLRELLTGDRSEGAEIVPKEAATLLTPILERACAREPLSRFDDAEQFQEALEEAHKSLSPEALAHASQSSSGSGRSHGVAGEASHTEVLGGGSHTKVLIDKEAPRGGGKGSRRTWLAAAAAVAVVGLGAWGVSSLGGSSHHAATSAGKNAASHSSSPSPRTVTMPNVVGSSESAARTQLSKLGLHTGTSEQVASTQPAGQVVSANPGEGTAVSTTTTVTLQVSSGATTPGAGQVAVPSVVGMTVGNARAVLGSFRLGVQTSAADTAPVTTQTPAAGSFAATGSSIQLN